MTTTEHEACQTIIRVVPHRDMEAFRVCAHVGRNDPDTVARSSDGWKGLLLITSEPAFITSFCS